MQLVKLNPDLVSKIRSSVTVNSIPQCVSELILNSLDAKSKSIAIRVNPVTLRIQVVDNGEGITESNMRIVGARYTTNKVYDYKDLSRKAKLYGFRGEALASICAVTKLVNVTSRCRDSDATYTKSVFDNRSSDVIVSNCRPSYGTTITIEHFLHNVPVRKRLINSDSVMEEIKISIEKLQMLNPQVSFTLRNEATGDLILNLQKKKDVVDVFSYLHPKLSKEVKLLKISKDKLIVEGFIHKETYKNKKLQYIYVNKRPVVNEQLQNYLCSLLKTSSKTKTWPIFLINIQCPYNEVYLSPSSLEVNFTTWSAVKQCLDKFINCSKSPDNLIKDTKVELVKKSYKGQCNAWTINGAVCGKAFKRKLYTDNIEVEINDELEKRCKTDENTDKMKVITKGNDSLEDLHVEEYKDTEDKHKIIKPNKTLFKNCLPIVVNPKNQNENNLSTYSKFTNNEVKGKNLIMDMFLKSTQVYSNSTQNYSIVCNPDCVETNLEPKDVVEYNEKGIQTSFKMPKQNYKSMEITMNKTVNIENYTFVVPKSVCDLKDAGLFSTNNESKCVCKKSEFMFNFTTKRHVPRMPIKYSKNNVTLTNINLSPIPKEGGPSLFNEWNNFLKDQYSIRKTDERCGVNYPESPYFVTNTRRLQYNENKNYSFYTFNNVMTTARCTKNEEPKAETQNKDHYQMGNKFQPLLFSTQKTDSLRFPFIQNHFDGTAPVLCTTRTVVNTFDFPECANQATNFSHREKESEVINLRKTLDPYDFHDKNKFTFLNDSINVLTREQLIEQKIEDKEKNHVDFIFNKRNDLVYQNSEKPSKDNDSKFPVSKPFFSMKQRPNFLPKGLSPVLLTKNIEVETSMTQHSKMFFHNALFQNVDDLKLLKWENYLQYQDPKIFFQKLYEEKAKLFEDDIPTADAIPKSLRSANGKTFQKDVFKFLQVIGQIDKKFIAAIDTRDKLLIIFDQHAAHERLRLEYLEENYRGVKVECATTTIFIRQCEIKLLRDNQPFLDSVGLSMEFLTNCVIIKMIPLCVYNNSKNEHDLSILNKTVEILIQELIEILQERRNVTTVTPNIIKKIISMEACRGAVKFGDKLDAEFCKNLIVDLGNCKLPFQCAHGRPTLTPLIYIDTCNDLIN
ncbi:DNA mismatch repair protein MutL [Aethina tumida]|uniref:DNA mismatch repair protein MutL n=1 Tax=Aethina tumida TaxID=116153 RepID=UPI0021481E97|nr:DNA mismatch repair protein MutL [Aethina tumida]